MSDLPSTAPARRYRRTEAFLLCLVFLTLVLGAATVAAGRIPSRTPPVLLNAAGAEQLAPFLPETARAIVADRAKHGPFPDVDALVRRRLVRSETLRRVEASLCVRSVADIQRLWWGAVAALALFYAVVHLLLRRFHPQADPYLLPAAALLSSLSLVLLFGIKDPLRDQLSFLQQTLGVLVGGGLTLSLTLSAALWRLPLHRYGYLYALLACVLIVLVGLVGKGPGGIRLSVGGVQPVEAVKLLLVFFLAAYLAERGPLLAERRHGLPRREDALPLLVLYALPLALFALFKDMGPALLLFGTFLALAYAATGRRRYVAMGLCSLLLAGGIGYGLGLGVFRTRIDMWLSPWDNLRPGGDQVAHALWGLASGGPAGSGPGRSGADTIPRAGSDLAFASLGEEMGIPGIAAVLAAFGVLTVRGIGIARRAPSDFERLLAAGLTALLTLQAAVIAGGSVGLLPLTGITLPLVAYGKSSLVASFAALGALLAISSRGRPSAAGSPPFARSLPRLGLALLIPLALIALRTAWFQTLAADATAVRTCRVPDADRVRRPHTNPRLQRLANRIPRGRLLDRNGLVLAETRPDGSRRYPQAEATAHLIGILPPEIGGPTGFEAEYQWKLRGFEAVEDLAELWRRKDLPGFALPEGRDIALSLDAPLQKRLYQALRRAAGAVRDRKTGQPKNRGAAVVLEVATGEVLAAVTSPSYDPNRLDPRTRKRLLADLNDEHPFINRALAGRYPPGSTFKVVTASALLENGLSDFTTLCRHVALDTRWRLGGQTFARRRLTDDESESAHGPIGLPAAVAQSCNLYFARAAIALGPEPLRQTAQGFGLSWLPSPPRFAAELPEISGGQGSLLVTPLEMADVAATIARADRRLRPQFQKGSPAESESSPLSPQNARRLAQMMREVTRRGTAAGRFDDLPFAVAGKTGTAQNREGDAMSHAWFLGFAPADSPRWALAVVVENGGYGARTAVPVAHDLLAFLAAR